MQTTTFIAKANPKTASDCDRVNTIMSQAYQNLSRRFLSPKWQGNELRVEGVPLGMQRLVRQEIMGIQWVLDQEGIGMAVEELACKASHDTKAVREEV